MKFDISVVLLLVIACMLGYVTYQSTLLVKATVVTAKINLVQAGKVKITRKEIEAIEL